MSSAEAPELGEAVEEVAKLLLRVYEIHEVIIEETGGVPGLHSAILLHSAVARPFATFGGEELYPSDFEKAAALFHPLIKNHPFLDGTKRTTFALLCIFSRNAVAPFPATSNPRQIHISTGDVVMSSLNGLYLLAEL